MNAVIPADVQKMTAQYLKPPSMTIVVVGIKRRSARNLVPTESGKPL